jgi:uncharacterized caspase-like protein
MLRTIVILFLALLFPAHAQAEKRVALAIGNSAYRHAPPLDNPRNDAVDIAAALSKLGLQVIEGVDLDRAGLERKVRDFAKALAGADLGVFFYAGHGLQVSGQNYLVPVDAELQTGSALAFETVRLEDVHSTMEREARTNVLFIDACRNNPLAPNLARSMGTRSTEVGTGLAPVRAASGTLISFSTQPGNVALDGTGRNSPFAAALVKHVSASSDDLSAILIAVRNDVMKGDGQQAGALGPLGADRAHLFQGIERGAGACGGRPGSRKAIDRYSECSKALHRRAAPAGPIAQGEAPAARARVQDRGGNQGCVNQPAPIRRRLAGRHRCSS